MQAFQGLADTYVVYTLTLNVSSLEMKWDLHLHDIYKCHILSWAFNELSLLVKYVNLMLEEKANVLVNFFDYTWSS